MFCDSSVMRYMCYCNRISIVLSEFVRVVILYMCCIVVAIVLFCQMFVLHGFGK